MKLNRFGTAAVIATLAGILVGCGGSGSQHHAGAEASSLTANPTVSADLAQARADIAKCVTGTPLEQAHTLKVLFLTRATSSNDVEATRERVLACLGVPKSQRQNFMNDAIKQAEGAHLVRHPVKNGVTFVEVNLPELLAKYQAKDSKSASSSVSPSPSMVPVTKSPASKA